MKLNLATTTNGAVFLPHQVAESMPFSSNKLPEILNRFSLKEKSAEAEIIKKELEECEEPAMEGEARYCATSLQSLIHFSTSKLGRNVNVLTNEVKTGNQEYEFGVGMKKVADKSVVCHKMNYPYAVFYCHTFTKTRTYMIPLVGVDGSKSKAMAACHSDTSAWHPQHVAFQVLKIKPGTVPVCHFLHNNAMVWIPKYIKEGSTVSAMGVVQRNENVLMIVPPPEPFPTGCQWAKCILPASLEGIVLRCEDTSKIDVIPV